MFRRDARLFLRCLGASAILLLVLAAVAAGAVFAGVRGRAFTPVRVDVVDGEDSTVSRMLVHTVRSMEAVSGLFETRTRTREDALADLDSGDAAAVVLLPGDFVGDIMAGRDAEGHILLAAEVAAQREIVESVARFGEILLASGQYGIFCGEELIAAHHLTEGTRQAFLNTANARLLSEAMHAEAALDVVVPETGVLGQRQALVACWTILTLLLLSAVFLPLFTRDATPGLLRRLRTAGVGPVRFLGGKLLLTFLFRWLLATLTVLVLARIGWTAWRWTALVWTGAAAFSVSLTGACLSLGFGNSGAAGISLVSGAGLLLCGGVVPTQLLPAAAVRIGKLSPFGAAMNLFAPALTDSIPADTGAAIFCALLYAGLACALLLWRLRRIRRGEASS